MAEQRKTALRCHICKKKRLVKIEEPYLYDKSLQSFGLGTKEKTILIFKAVARCDKCGYVHGELVDFK